MELQDKVVMITGGADGIDRALAERFDQEVARGVAVADLHAEAVREVAGSVGGLALTADVSRKEGLP